LRTRRGKSWSADSSCGPGGGNPQESEDERTLQRRRELAAAFRLVAATRSADKEGREGGAVATRDVASVQALKLAHKLERSVEKIIRSIGEVIVNAEPPAEDAARPTMALRSDDAFEYFCEKAILALLVDIVRDKPYAPGKNSASCFHGVVWSPAVKAQVFQTVSLLVSGLRDASALYFILSQHCINQLIISVLPLQQWTDPALELMLPAFVDLLKNLSLQLTGSPELFPLFTVEDKEGCVTFPLFSVITQITISSHAQSDSFVHATCMNLIVGLIQIGYPSIHGWICQADREQSFLANHFCRLLTGRYQRISNLSTGPVVDAVRSNALAGQLAGLKNQIDALNDVFCCDVKVLNVRLCEALLRHFVAVLLKDLLTTNNRQFLVNVGETDADVIPAREAAAQASTFLLSRLFLHLEYTPFVRMLAVALFHPRSLKEWEIDNFEIDHEYALTRGLNALVESTATDAISNPYREEILKALRGDYGEWRFVPSAMLCENVLELLDVHTLVKLEIIPRWEDSQQKPSNAVESALESFLTRRHSRESAISTAALECAASLAAHYLHKASVCMRKDGKDVRTIQRAYPESSVWKALTSTRSYFYRETLESQNAIGVTDIFVDLVEAAVVGRYRCVANVRQGVLHSRTFVYMVSQHGSVVHGAGPEALVRKLRGVDLNDVEHTRFHAQMALHFRAVCRVIDAFHSSLSGDGMTKAKSDLPALDMTDNAGELSSIFGGLLEKPAVGTDLDLRGRMTFRFSSAVGGLDSKPKNAGSEVEARTRTFSEDMIFRSASNLVLVLDPTDIFVVKPVRRNEVNRGTILCCIPLLNVIAAAADGESLHVAVRNDDVRFLIKNGNMAFTFESAGTCLIVQQYLNRCRCVLRRELLEKIKALFSEDDQQSGDTSDDADPTDVPHVKTL
jgi:protein CLEC16A